MKINTGSTGPLLPNASRNERGTGADKTDESSSPATSRVDSVEISDAGRAKAAESKATRDAPAAHLQEIRARILRGTYDTDEVVAEVARRILDRGDL